MLPHLRIPWLLKLQCNFRACSFVSHGMTVPSFTVTILVQPKYNMT
jgi:hypothetical protein